MADIVRTKLMAPRAPRGVVRRRLLDEIDATPAARLVLMQAGAGYGKTSLVSSYVQASRTPCLWYQLDADDADPATLVRYLEHGWRNLAPDCPPPSAANLRDFLAVFVRALDAFGRPLLVVLEDYHLVQDCAPLHRFVDRLIHYAPANARLIITSRTRPPLPLSRYRARGWLVEITAESLRFTREETAELLGDLGLGEAERDRIWEQTEGWAAALVLARHALQTAGHPRARASAAGLATYTDEYITDEVLRTLPPDRVAFLEQTSILDFPEPDVCRALTGADATGHLDALARDNTFVTFLGEGPTYRYHHLLRDHLRRRLVARLGDGGLAELHRLAADFYLRRGDRAQAAHHLFQAGDADRLASLLLDLAPALLDAGDHARLQRWLRGLPEEVVLRRPALLYFRGRVELAGDWRAAAVGSLTEAEAGFLREGDRPGAAHSALALAAAANDRGQGAEGSEHALRALAHLETVEGEPALRGEICSALSQACLLQERWDEATTWADRAASLFQTGGHRAGEARLMSQDYQFFIYHPQQDLRQALRAFRAARQMWVQAGNRQEALMALVSTAVIHRITGEYGEAERVVASALREADDLGFARGRALGLLVLAQLRRDQGELEPALEAFHDAIFLAQQLDLVQLEAAGHHGLSGLYRRRGNLEAAARHARQALDLAEKTGVTYFLGQARMNMGMVHWAAGDLAQARSCLAAARATFARWQASYELARVHFYLAAVILQALERRESPGTDTADPGGDDLPSLAAEGLRLVRSNDYRFFFRREKDHVLPVLRWMQERGIEAAHVGAALAELGEGPAAPAPAALEVYALGPLEVRAGGRPVLEAAWRNTKVQALFRFLLARRRAKVPRDVLLETFWPDMDPEPAGHNLSSCLHTLRRALEPHLKKAGSSRLIRFEKGLCWLEMAAGVRVDADAFVEAVQRARRERAAGRPDEAAAAYGDANALYRGDFLEEYPYDDWLAPERERLRDTWVRAQQDLAALLEERGDSEGAVSALEQACRREPLREELLRRLISCLLRSGRRAEAIEHYRRFRQLLRRELGTEPSEETQKLLGD